MPKAEKALAEMTLGELATEYNKLSPDKPVKKFSDRPSGIRRLSALRAAARVASRPAATTKKIAEEPKDEIGKLLFAFQAREGSKRYVALHRLALKRNENVTQTTLLNDLYSNADTKNIPALGMVIKGAIVTIAKHKLPYEIKYNKQEKSYGLFDKR